MAVPKRKMSRSNTRSRRANWKATAVATTDSSMTDEKMRLPVAPKLRRTPISRMRWRMATSWMLTRPRPPSSSTSPAIPPVTSSNVWAYWA